MIRLNYSVKINFVEREIPGVNCGLISLSFYDYILIGEPHSASYHVAFYAIEFFKNLETLSTWTFSNQREKKILP